MRTVAVFLITLTAGIGVLFLPVSGGGILPVSPASLFLVALAASVAAAFVSSFVRRGLWLAILSFLGVAVVVRVYTNLEQNGLSRAKDYAARLASEITSVRRERGDWPSDLKELPAGRRPRLERSEMWPYEYVEEDGFYRKVGGYVIWYGVDNGRPDLKVFRREVGVVWDWEGSRWAEATPR